MGPAKFSYSGRETKFKKIHTSFSFLVLYFSSSHFLNKIIISIYLSKRVNI